MDKKIYGIIYLLIDGTNDFEYIGQTIRSLEVRFKEHATADSCIGKAIQNHGELFLKVTLKICYSQEELNYWERHFIKSRDTLFPNGYNMTVSGGIFRESKLDSTPYKNLLAEMDKFQLSYSALAKILGGTSHNASRKMLGKRKFTEIEIIKLVKFFDKPAEYLMERVDGEKAVSRFKESHYKNLLTEMDNRQLSYKALAKLMNLNENNFSYKMRGKQIFTEHQIDKLVEIFGLPAEYLLERDDGLPATISKMERNAKASAIRRFDSPYKNLITELDDYNFSYSELAKLIGLSFGTVSDKMRGERKFTSRDIAKLVKIFGKPADYLLARDDGENAISEHYKTPFKNLLAEMDKRKLTYTAFAKLLGLKMANVSAKMLGERKFMEQDKAKLVEFFGLPAEYLFERDDGITEISEEERQAKLSVAHRFDSPFKNLLGEMDLKQLSYGRLAELLSLSQPTISDKMRGERNFTTKDIARLIKIFDKPADYLLARDDGKDATLGYYKTPYKNLLSEIDKKNFLYKGLAQLLDLSQPTVSDKMSGKISFTARDVEKLVEIFDKPADYLMARDDA